MNKDINKPRILFFDIETMSNKIYAWGIWDVNAIEVLEHWYMLSFSWKWSDETTTHVRALPDYKGYKSNPKSDESLVNDLWKLFNEASVIVAHNGRAFDIKKSNARFAKYGLKPPSPYKIIDTKEVAKRYFKFDSNRLDSLADYFSIGRKINTGGFSLWLGCEKGDMKSWDKMKKYNKYDVVLLEKVYKHMMPYMTNHPNLALLNGVQVACPNCNSTNVTKKGFTYSRVSKSQQFRCSDCGSWHSAPLKGGQVR